MKTKSNQNQSLNRRGFLGTLSASAAALGVSMMAAPVQAAFPGMETFTAPEAFAGDHPNPDEWFNKLSGKQHKTVFDMPEPINSPILPFAWTRVYMMTNAATGTPAEDLGVVNVLRHHAIIYALNDDQWKKYQFGKAYSLTDPTTNKPLVRNPFWKPAPGAFVLPGAGEVKLGIDQLMEDGAMFCVCQVALGVYSGIVAQKMGLTHEEVKNDWIGGVLPGIQPVPSGVWAVNRAQEHGCSYCMGYGQ